MRDKVSALGLDVDVYVDYGRGILEDEDSSVEERVQSVIGIFSGAADGVVSDAVIASVLNEREMIADVERVLSEAQASKKKEKEMKRVEAELRGLEIREHEKKEAELAMEKEKEKQLARQKM